MIGKRIRELRLERGLSQNALVSRVEFAHGFTQSNLAKWERGEHEPSANALVVLARFFDVSVDYLLGLENEFGDVERNYSEASTAPQISPTLAKNIKELRNERGMTQRELAKAIKVAPSVIHYWENGTNEPKASYLLALAKFFDMSVDYLLGEEYKPTTTSVPHLSPAQRIVSEQVLGLLDEELPLVSVFIDGIVAKRTAGSGSGQKFGKK